MKLLPTNGLIFLTSRRERGGNIVTKEELFQRLKPAIDNEYEAYRLYTDIAEKSGYSELGVVFKKIADEELAHRETIMERYALLKDLAD